MIDALGGKTPRAAYIETSRLLKEQHNDNIIADLTLESTFGSRQPVLVNSDLGFNCEGRVFQDYYGAANCLIVKVSRPGFEFNDNRAYVDLPDVETVHVNNIDPDQYKKDLIKISERHLQPKIQCAPSFR